MSENCSQYVLQLNKLTNACHNILQHTNSYNRQASIQMT